jgi:glycosyltransferase involved in cell wall biosynthesis
VTAARTIGLLYGHCLDVGGVETHLLSLMRRSDPEKWRWRVLARTSPGFAEKARAAGASVEPWAPRHALDAAAVSALVACARSGPLDVLHAHDPRALPLARLAGTRLHLPVVYTVHLPVSGDTGDGSPARRRLYGAAERAILRFAPPDRIVQVSARARQESGANGNRHVVLVPNGVDLERAASAGAREAVRAALGAGPEVVVILSVARLVPQKGLDTLIDAFARVPGRPHLWIAGDGTQRRELEARAARLGVSDRLRLLGRRDDVADLLAAGDVFALASRHETTPIALLEAMAAGRGCVVTDVGDCRAMLGEGSAGLVVPPRDQDALAAGLAALVADRSLRDRLGQSARARTGLYSDLAMAERTATVYETLGG